MLPLVLICKSELEQADLLCALIFCVFKCAIKKNSIFRLNCLKLLPSRYRKVVAGKSRKNHFGDLKKSSRFRDIHSSSQPNAQQKTAQRIR